MMGMGLREYSRHRGVSLAAVQKALDTGRIQKESDGTINPVKANKAWEANTDQAQQRTHSAVIRPKQEPEPTMAPTTAPTLAPTLAPTTAPTTAPNLAPRSNDPAVVPATKGLPSYADSRSAHEYFKAQTAKLEYEQQKKILVLRKTVDDEIFSENRRVRDRLQNIPGRVAPILAAMTDILEIEKMIAQEIYDALVELS